MQKYFRVRTEKQLTGLKLVRINHQHTLDRTLQNCVDNQASPGLTRTAYFNIPLACLPTPGQLPHHKMAVIGCNRRIALI